MPPYASKTRHYLYIFITPSSHTFDKSSVIYMVGGANIKSLYFLQIDFVYPAALQHYNNIYADIIVAVANGFF